MPNIVLTGFMGTGKSTVGRILSRDLGLGFLDLDSAIEEKEGIPVAEIFSRHGEPYFRDLETSFIKRLSSGEFGEGLVVSLGGGAVVRKENREALRNWGLIVCLTASMDEILRRVGDRPDRPLLDTPEKRNAAETLLDARREAYMDCDLSVDTTGSSAEDVVSKIKVFIDPGRRGRGKN